MHFAQLKANTRHYFQAYFIFAAWSSIQDMDSIHTKSVEELLKELDVSPDVGLSDSQIEERSKKYGLNGTVFTSEETLFS